MQRSELIDELGASDLGEVLERSDLERLADAGRVRDTDRGELLRREGERAVSLLVLLAGSIEVLKQSGGEPRRLAEIGAGAALGEVGLLCGLPATASLRTLEPCRLFELDGGVFASLVAAGEPIALRLSLAMARQLASRLAQMNERALELCDEYAAELERAASPERDRRVRDLAAFRAQLAGLQL